MGATTYECVISDVGFADYTIPISSFQMRLRNSPKQCYLSVIVPAVLDHAQAIADRIDGTITLTRTDDGVETELLDANISEFRQFLGANSRTGEITAYKQITFSSPATRDFPSAYYKGTSGTVTRYRMSPQPANPGDTLNIGGDSFEPTEIYWSANPTRSTMEVANG